MPAGVWKGTWMVNQDVDIGNIRNDHEDNNKLYN